MSPECKRLKSIYSTMKQRCYNPNRLKYSRYGGRGIKICDEWLNSFDSFYNWAINNGYSSELQIDRIDNDGDYCPENCRWVTLWENTLNRRQSKFLTVNGETLNASIWAERLNISPFTIYWWIREKSKEYAEMRLTEIVNRIGGVPV